jgi:anti-sigma regulatory factor (Ser/Thr protein kinase)
VTQVTAQPTVAVGGFVHPALFYRGPDEYLEGTVPFVREGLAAGEPVAVAVPTVNLALLRAELASDAERVRLLDMTEVGRNPGRIIPGVLRAFADAQPPGRVRIIGEPIWAGRTAAEYPACAQHEALINAAFAGRPVTILCPYDVDGLDAAVLSDALVTHPVLIDSDGRRDSAGYAPEEIVARYNEPLVAPPDAITVSFDRGNLAQVRRVTAASAERAGVAGDRLYDVQIAVNELATNSIVHGGGSGTLRIWSEESHLVFEVHDAGQLTDPLVGRRPVQADILGGRGVLLVNHLADLVRMYTGDDGTTIRVLIRR